MTGKITGFFGLKGYMKVLPASSDPERLASLEEVMVGANESAATAMSIEDVILRQGAVLVKLQGVDDRTAAEAFAGGVAHPDDAQFTLRVLVGDDARDLGGADVESDVRPCHLGHGVPSPVRHAGCLSWCESLPR